MPRIRKKTSKRGTVRKRESIKHKISEHRKKTKKQARKGKAAGKPVQKKSKKDPGIPNDFPYKDRILAEVAERRRQAAAEKQRRKEEKQAAAANKDGKSPTPDDMDVDENGFDGVMSLRPVLTPKNKGDAKIVQEAAPVISVYPGPLTLRQVVEKADVVLHVVDARDPMAGMSEALAEAARDKMMVLLNKADRVPRESLVRWLAHLRRSYTVVAFKASSAFVPSATPLEPRNNKGEATRKDDAMGLDDLWASLDDVARTKNTEELVVAVTGVTNAGKSAVIDSILGSEALTIYNMHTAASAQGPYTTTSAQEVVATMPGNDARRVRFIDTPGLQFVRDGCLTHEEREAERVRDILLRSRGRIDRLKDPLAAVKHIVAHGDTRDLMLAYGLPAFLQGDVTGFLSGLGRVSGLMKMGGMPDHAGAARIVLRDWSTGKLMRYTVPGTSGDMADKDSKVLGAVKSKKELLGMKLVKMDAGEMDKRPVKWDDVWEEEEEKEGEEEGEEEDDDDDDDDDDEPGRRRVSFATR